MSWCCLFVTWQFTGSKPLPCLVSVRLCESGEARTSVCCIYWQWYHCREKRRERRTAASLKPNSCMRELRRREPANTYTAHAHWNQSDQTAFKDTHTFTGCQTLTTTANSCHATATAASPDGRHRMWTILKHTQMNFTCKYTNPETHMQVTYPPEVLPVSIFQQRFVCVTFPNQRAKTCPLRNQFLTGHPKHLFNKEDMKWSKNRVAHKLEAWASSRMHSELKNIIRRMRFLGIQSFLSDLTIHWKIVPWKLLSPQKRK